MSTSFSDVPVKQNGYKFGLRNKQGSGSCVKMLIRCEKWKLDTCLHGQLSLEDAAETNLSPYLSPLPNLFVVCVCKGAHPQWSSWRRSCQRPGGCWPSRKLRNCPSRESTRRLTHTRRWLSSKLRALKHLEDKGRRCSPEMNFCPSPVVSYLLYCILLYFFFFFFQELFLTTFMDLSWQWSWVDHLCFSCIFHGLGKCFCFDFKLYSSRLR